MKIAWNITFPKMLSLFHLFQKQNHLKNLAKSKLFDSTYLWKDIAESYSFTSNLEFIRYKFRNWIMQKLHWSFVSEVENHSTLPVIDENYLKCCIFAVLILFYMFQHQEYFKSLARSKPFDSTYLWKVIPGSKGFTWNLEFIN